MNRGMKRDEVSSDANAERGPIKIGSLLGSVIPFNTEGIDFALTALFITVFVEQWLDSKKHSPALIGVGASVICLLIFGSESFLIPSMIIITALLVIIRKKEVTDNA